MSLRLYPSDLFRRSSSAITYSFALLSPGLLIRSLRLPICYSLNLHLSLRYRLSLVLVYFSGLVYSARIYVQCVYVVVYPLPSSTLPPSSHRCPHLSASPPMLPSTHNLIFSVPAAGHSLHSLPALTTSPLSSIQCRHRLLCRYPFFTVVCSTISLLHAIIYVYRSHGKGMG
jgi:hypothetical protein